MKPSSRKLLLAFSALGLASSSMSSYVHYRLLTEPGFTSFCDVNATVSCTEAYLSQYGSFWGVPVALGGVFFFSCVLLLALVAGRRTSPAGENAPAYIFALSTLALAFVLYLAWAAFFVLKAFCILCGVTYAAVVAVFIISGGATPFPMTTLPRRAARDLRTLVSSPASLVITLLFALGAVSVIAAFPRENTASGSHQEATTYQPLSDAQRADIEKWFDLQPRVDVPIPTNGAKVLVVKFNDYQCPPCRQTYDLYAPIFQKYSGKGVKFVLKHFPLEPECNSVAGNHYAACEAAAAVIMARSKGTAEKLEAWLFAHQGPPQLTPDQVKEAAREIGGITDFDAQYERALVEVKNDAGMGSLLGVTSTPTFFINGRRLAGGHDPRLIDAIIELELKRAK
jgi:uncharacterized membrane protein/protein-disulfide isomerase